MAIEPASGAGARRTDARVLTAAVGLALAGLLVLFWPVLCTAPAIHWNPARLAPSFALAYGHSIYALRNSAEQLGWIYGPVFPLWYFPVTATQNPTLAILLGTLGNAVTLGAPVVLAVRAAGVRRRSSLILAGVVTFALLQAHAEFRWMLYFIHVDAVCLALGLIGCLALHRAATRDQPRGLALHAAALAVALALWTKQLAVMLAPGMLLWLWTAGHRRLLGPFFFWSACYVGIVSLGVFAWFGTDRVLFNVVLYHLRSPAEGGVTLILKWLGGVVRDLWTWVPLIGVAIWIGRNLGERRREKGEGNEALILSSRARSLIHLLLWVALAQLPLGLLALLRPDAGVNSLHSLHYLLVAAVIWLVHLVERSRWALDAGPWTLDFGQTAEGRPGFALRASAQPTRLALAWGTALVVTVAFGFLLTVKAEAQWALYRGQEQMLATVRAKPGQYYLPWNPLVTLIAERKVYPFDDALLCLWKRQLAVPIEVVRAAVPAKPIIFYEEPVQSKFALTYFQNGKP